MVYTLEEACKMLNTTELVVIESIKQDGSFILCNDKGQRVGNVEGNPQEFTNPALSLDNEGVWSLINQVSKTH